MTSADVTTTRCSFGGAKKRSVTSPIAAATVPRNLATSAASDGASVFLASFAHWATTSRATASAPDQNGWGPDQIADEIRAHIGRLDAGAQATFRRRLGAAGGDIDALADLNEAVQEAAADYAQE